MSKTKKNHQNIKEELIHKLPKKAWTNLLLFVLLFYFLAFIGQPLVEGNWCLLNDYLGYYSAGQIMNMEGPSQVYDYELLGKYQADLYQMCGNEDDDLEIVSMVYLPIFLAPFQLLALLEFPTSVFLWIVLTFILLFFYLWFFTKKIFNKIPPLHIFLMIIVSTPVFRNFIHGQVNILLLIGMGEFIRAIIAEKPYRAGLWLGLFLVKPQMLILILPFLLIQKQFKALVGFILSSMIVGSASLLVGGLESMGSFISVILDSANGGATSNYQLMMNWRAVSYFVNNLLGSGPAWVVLISGSLINAGIVLFVFRKKAEVSSPDFMIGLLGVMAATLVVTYHAHTHSAMAIIPIMLYLWMNKIMSEKVYAVWLVTPSAFNLLQFLIGALVVLSILPFGFAYFVNFSIGIWIFGLNLYLMGWSVFQIKPKKIDGKNADYAV